MLSKGSHRYGPFEPVLRLRAHHFGAVFASRHARAPRYRRRALGAHSCQSRLDFCAAEAWLNAVMARESGGKTVLNGRPITSAAGAMGLMQVVPSTYDDLRKQLGLGADPYAPADNITVGAAYLQ